MKTIILCALVACSSPEELPTNRGVIFAHMLAPTIQCTPIDTGWGFVQDSAYCPVYDAKGVLAAVFWCRGGGWNPPSCVDVMLHAPPPQPKGIK